MLPETDIRQIGILGDGCAAMSLAARADELPGFRVTIYQPDDRPAPADHIWGFWTAPHLERAAKLAFASWQNWKIVSENGAVTMTAQARPYHAMRRSTWMAYCHDAAKAAKVGYHSLPPRSNDPATIFLDSRPPKVPTGMMLQHFLGLEVRAKDPVFTSDTAILMDFRVDQSRGMHFIYLLPFSTTEALVESTLFTPQVEDEDFYISAISDYLSRHLGLTEYDVVHRERGVIPLGVMPRHDPQIPGIGGNGGAIRPSSGYAFAFIQKQIDRAIAGACNSGLAVSMPHQAIDLWMDAVLLHVLRQFPQLAPDLFLRMAAALTGDEFATFLSGEAGWRLRLKVILAMPKWPFLKAGVRLVLANPGLSVRGRRAWT